MNYPFTLISMEHSHPMNYQYQGLLLKTLSHCSFFHNGGAGTGNPGVTRKPANTLKGIRNLVLNGTQNQWTHGLDVLT